MRDCQLHSRIYIITVIYNRQIDEIRSLPEFQILMDRHPGVGLIVADNSTDANVLERNRRTAAESGWLIYEAAVENNGTIHQTPPPGSDEAIHQTTSAPGSGQMIYLECGGNVGLSRAYNKALAAIPKDEAYWVMLSDDDTEFSLEYLENGCRQIERQALRTGTSTTSRKDDRNAGRESLRVLCGVVLTGRGWISPRSEHAKELAFSQVLRKPKPGIYRDLYPINSGLFLEGSAIREVGGFDERLFLDQVDFLMMDRLRARGIRRIGVLPGEIRQAFSGEVGAGTGTVQSSDKRWKIFRKDFETYCDLTNKPWYYRAYILGRRWLMLGMQQVMRGR